MRTIKLSFISWMVAAAVLQFSVEAGAPPFTAFGLTNTPIGDANITFENRTMVVTAPGGIDYDASITAAGAGILSEGSWGVSVQLGEADAGIFVYPYHRGYVNDGNFLTGRVVGNVDDQEETDVCFVRARRQSEGNHSVTVDFSPIGAHTQVFEVFSGDRLIRRHTNEGGTVIVHTYSQSGPRVNPFWRLRDGSIAVVVELSETESMTLPNDVEARPYGNRLIIRAVDPAREVKFVTQVDVTGGGGLDHFLITEMRLGMFNHPHIALDSTLLGAAEGKLAVTNPDYGSNSSQHAVAVELEGLNRFDVNLSPVELGTNGAAMVASVVGRVNRIEGEFVGYAGVRNSNGVLQAFASLPVLQPEVEIAVYRDGCLVGSVLAPGSEVVVPLSGRPKLVGFGATANGPQNPPGLGITLDGTTIFRLLNGTTEYLGDEIRFRAPGPFAIEELSTFVLCASGLPAFTICGETTPQTIALHDFLTEWTPDSSINLFTDREARSFQRTVTRTNRQGQALVQVNNTYASSNLVSEFYSFQGGDLYLHGSTAGAVDQFSAAGMRWLPAKIQLGETYVNSGSFAGYLAGSGETYTVMVTNLVRAAGYDTLDLPAGTFTALRIESVTSSSFSTASNSPVLITTQTNWLVPGIGLIKFFSTLQDGTFVGSGELAAYNILTLQPRDQVANIGASISFGVSVNAPFDHPGGAVSYRWLRDGVPLANYSESLSIQNVQSTDMGSYSVVVSNAAGVVTSAAGSLHVVPFSEPSCFWATRASGTLSGHGHSVYSEAIVADGAGNLYVAGSFVGVAVFGATTLTSAGGYDVFLAKLDSSGQYLWARRTGGSSDEVARALDLDAAGNLYLAGNFNGAAAFDAITLISQGGDDVFVAMADSNGNYLWAARAGGSSPYERATDLAVDSAGNVHVTGSFYGTADFGEFTLSADNSALFLAKLNTNGDFLLARSVDHAAPGALDSGPAGSVYLTGTLYQPATFGTDVITPGRFGAAGFLSKLDATDEFVWTRKLGDVEGSHDVAVDAAGNVYVSGAISGTATLGKIALSGNGNPYNSKGFLARLDANGNFLWASRALGGWLAVDSGGDAYVFGGFYGTLETSLATYLSYFASGSTPLLVSKVSRQGQTLWSRQFGGDYSRAIAVDPAGSVYLAGNFSGMTRFGNFILPSGGNQYNNLFVARMCGPTPPAITGSPQSLTVEAGSNATFTVTATGADPLTYQWRKNGLNIAGATGDSLTVPNVQESDEGDYTLLVESGGISVASGVATLTVISPYAGTLAFGAVNYQISEAGVVAVIDVRRTGVTAGLVTVDFGTGNGTALAGHDYVAAAGTLRFGDGESLATFSVPILDDPLFEGDETIVLRLCRPTGGAVLASPETASLTISENDAPSPVILTQPSSRAVARSESVTFRVSATGMAPLHYQWLKDGSEIPGASDFTYVIPSAQPGDVGVYSVIVSNAAGIAISHEATLTIIPPPVILEHPQSQTVVRGHSVTLSVVASSVNTSTQSFARAATGPREDRFLITTAGSEGRLVIHYDFFIVPDSLRIYRGGALIFNTGFTNGSGSATIFYGPTLYSRSEDLEIVVNEGDTSNAITAWGYELFLVPETLNYEWRKDGILIPGANRPALNIHNARAADAGQYTVTVRDRYGSVVSQVATLSVVTPSPPTLHMVRRGDGQIQFSWDAQNFSLEEAETFEGPWYYVSSDSHGVLIEPVDYWRFYRLRENFSE